MKKSFAVTNLNKKLPVSHVVGALRKLEEQISTDVQGQFDCKVRIKAGNAVISSDDLDIEFDVEFDDNTTADTAEITVYNLTDQTINQFAVNQRVTIEAGYGTDTGVIYTGYITQRKSHWEGIDKIMELRAVDDRSRVEMDVESITYAAGTKASYILKDLCGRVGLPIAVFKVERDYTYTDKVHVNGDLAREIQQFAEVCKVSAYICKSKIYVRSLKDGDNIRFDLSSDTGLLKVKEFEEEVESREEGYSDTVRGFEVEMLGQHRIQTAAIINLKSKSYNGTFRVKEGRHTYDYGGSFVTEAKIVEV